MNKTRTHKATRQSRRERRAVADVIEWFAEAGVAVVEVDSCPATGCPLCRPATAAGVAA